MVTVDSRPLYWGVAGVLLLWSMLLCGYDIRYRRLPDWLTLPGAVVALSAGAAAGCGGAALGGAFALGAVYLAVYLSAPAGMGGGDVKLAVGLGAVTGCFGAAAWLFAALGAALLTVVGGLAALRVRGQRTVPHGPSMCAASLVAVLLAVRCS